MKRVYVLKAYIVLVICLLFTGCGQDVAESMNGVHDRPNLATILDYTDWYYDIDNTGVYNYANSIELDIWFKENINGHDWSDVTYDVSYEGQIIESDISVIVNMNYMKCNYDNSYAEAFLTEYGSLAPGLYEIALKDGDNNLITSAACYVTVESGEVLSKMIIGIDQIEEPNDQLALRISFDGDITRYSKTGFFVFASLDGGKTIFVPDDYSIEPADTYITIRYYAPDINYQNVIISLYCGDGTFVCSKELET